MKNVLLALGLVSTLALTGCQEGGMDQSGQAAQTRQADTANVDLSGNYDTSRDARTGNSASNEMQEQSATVQGREKASDNAPQSAAGQDAASRPESPRPAPADSTARP